MGNSQGLNFLNGVKMDRAPNATAQRRHHLAESKKSKTYTESKSTEHSTESKHRKRTLPTRGGTPGRSRRSLRLLCDSTLLHESKKNK